MGDLNKLSRLSISEGCLLVIFVVALPIVARLLKHRGFRRTEQLLARFSRRTVIQKSEAQKSEAQKSEAQESRAENSRARVQSTARMVSVAAHRGPFNAQCLEQAVTLWWMLGLMGIESTIRMGIYKKGDLVEAHAWVLHDDDIVLGELERLAEYTPLLDVNIERPK